MKNAKKILAIVLAIVTVCVAFVGCQKAADNNADAQSGKKVMKLATSADFPPYEFIGEDGEYKGIDVEVATAVANKLGADLEVVNMDFDSILGAVSTGKCDFGMAGITVTPERAQSVDFSNPYATGIQAVIVKEGSPIKTVDDLYADGANYKVGVQLSTTGDIYFSDDIAQNKTTCTVQKFTVNVDTIEALKTGKVDAVIIDNEPAKAFVEANEGLTILDTKYAEEDYAMALKKNNELTPEINKALDELKADGTIQQIIDKYIPAK